MGRVRNGFAEARHHSDVLKPQASSVAGSEHQRSLFRDNFPQWLLMNEIQPRHLSMEAAVGVASPVGGSTGGRRR